MAQSSFDSSKAITFDLEHGRVSLDDAPSTVLVPGEALLALANSAGTQAAVVFAQALGEPLGLRVARRLGGDRDEAETTRNASIEDVVDALGGELALAGLGALSIERWGRALVLVLDHSPFGAEGDLLLATIVAAALFRVTSREVYCWPLMRDRTRARFLVANKAAVARARASIEQGASWGDALAQLHAPSAEARGAA